MTIYEDAFTRRRCEGIAGKLSDSTWSDWRKKALATVDRGAIPYRTNSFATHVALITISVHLAGNSGGDKPRGRFNQISTKALAKTLLTVAGEDVHRWARAGELLPNTISQEELDAKIAEIRPQPSRSKKYEAGWRIAATYTRTEATSILRKLNHHEFTKEWSGETSNLRYC
jgi:hypothetical protein